MNKLVLAVVGLMLAAPASAQAVTPTGAAAPAAAAADVATVDAIIAALYDVISGPAGQARDWNRFRSLFVSEARLVSAGVPRGGTRARARVLSIEDYVEANGPLLEERGFFEREIGRVTERFENMVHAFSTYESRSTADGAVFQRGMNSIQLLHDGERWWIVTVMWWGVGPDFTISKKYLSKPS